jgi:hypothetical protein
VVLVHAGRKVVLAVVLAVASHVLMGWTPPAFLRQHGRSGQRGDGDQSTKGVHHEYYYRGR